MAEHATIRDADYPRLVEFMDKFLYQLAAPSLYEAIAIYKVAGTEAVEKSLNEIARLLAAEYAESELTSFIDKHSDYTLESARSTLEYFIEVLKSKTVSQ
jgi:hypothetical protein